MQNSIVDKNTKNNLSTALQLTGLMIFMALLILTMYTLAHEGGHALAGLLLGGKITAFSINFFDLSAHVGIDGEFTQVQRAIISLAGVSLPLLLCMGLVVLAPKKGNIIFLWFRTGVFMGTVNSLLAWIVIPVLVWMGNSVGDDSANFLRHTNLSPRLVTMIALLVYLACWVVFLNRSGGLRGMIAQQRPGESFTLSFPEVRRTILILGIIGALTLAVGLGLTMAYPDTKFSPPEGYQLAAELDLSRQGYSDQSVYEFQLNQPSKASFFILLTNVKGSPVRVVLEGPDGLSNTFLMSDEQHFEAGRASVHPQGVELEPGPYQLRVTFQPSRGKVSIYTKID